MLRGSFKLLPSNHPLRHFFLLSTNQNRCHFGFTGYKKCANFFIEGGYTRKISGACNTIIALHVHEKIAPCSPSITSLWKNLHEHKVAIFHYCQSVRHKSSLNTLYSKVLGLVFS